MRIVLGTTDGDAHDVYLNGTRVGLFVEADTEKGYVVVVDRNKGTYDQWYGNYVRKLQGKVELVHKYTGAVVQ